MSEFVVYKVTNQFRYYYDDDCPVFIQRGLNSYEAWRKSFDLCRTDKTLPLNPSGSKQLLYKYCQATYWDDEMAKRSQLDFFDS